MITSEYINRFQQNSSVSYDLIFSEDGEEKNRLHVQFKVDDDTEEKRNQLVSLKMAYISRENRLAYVNSKLDGIKSRLISGVDQLIEGARQEIIKELYGSSNQ